MKRTAKSATPSAAPVIRCAVYTRKSTEEGLEQEFNSLDAQREAGENYIKSQGLHPPRSIGSKEFSISWSRRQRQPSHSVGPARNVQAPRTGQPPRHALMVITTASPQPVE